MTSICKTLYELVRLWWRHDRIRVSPVEGRLLRIEPSDVLRINNQEVEVLARSIFQEARGMTLLHPCRTATEEAELSVHLDHEGKFLFLDWKAGGNRRVLLADDIEVWQRH